MPPILYRSPALWQAVMISRENAICDSLRTGSSQNMNKYAWLFFVLGAALSWGSYVPTIHHGQLGLPAGANRALKAFLYVGLAYFLVAVIIPGGLLAVRPDNAGYSRNGIVVSTVAGVLGALGALCV